MTQEEHWKKAYRDLQEKYTAEGTERDERYRIMFDDVEKRFKEGVEKINTRHNQATVLIDELERVLHFTHDDIRSNLAPDTVVQIEQALDAIKKFHGLKPVYKR